MSAPARARSPLRIAVAAALGASLLWLALMFILANDDWVVVRLPSLPGSTAPSAAAFEARSFAVMLAAFSVGAAAATLLWRRAVSAADRRMAAERERAARMESELAALGRLVASTRERNGGAP